MLKTQQITKIMHERTGEAISLLLSDGILGSVRFMCLRNLKPVVRSHWTVLPIPVLVNVINKLSSGDSKNSIIVGQDPLFTRGDPDIQARYASGYYGPWQDSY